MYYSSLLTRKIGSYLIVQRKFTEFQKLTNGLSGVRSLTQKPRDLTNQSTFNWNLLKSRFNISRKYSTDKDPTKTQFSKFDIFLLYFVNYDTLITLIFSVFLYYDYKRYKEKGRGILIR